MRRLAACLTLSLCFLFGAGKAEAGLWYMDYHQALHALEKGKFDVAEDKLRDLISRRVVPRENARTYGVWRIDYTPYYHLGLALAHQGRIEEAREVFDFGLNWGVLQRDPKRLATVERLREQATDTDILARASTASGSR